ncbi:helix-turn-helix transcriptional regulator [Acidobacteria bacterium AH-259-O06]|nr:helix-turn-helix transcriptional regulator [Acidobacteria bacterium AH-259-O06]
MVKKRAGFTISIVANMYEIHPQTLRAYEREGLLKPSRTEGNTRLYTEEDLQQLELILTLTRELGVNLAGVEVILHMREKMERMHNEVEQLIEYLRAQFDLDSEFFQRYMKEALVRVPPSNLIRVMREEPPGSKTSK